MPIREQNQVLLFKHQSGQGVQATPSASVDAIKIVSANVRRDTNMIQTNEKQASLYPAAPIPAGTKVTVDIEVLVKGSGTPGTAPEIGTLFESSYLKKTITATAVPSSAEACAAGTTTSATLAAGASASAQAYLGMPVVISGSPATGAEGTYLIVDYTTGKVALLASTAGIAIGTGNDYQIPINVRYLPTSVEADVPFGTMELYTDGKKETFMDVRGTVTSTWEAGGIIRATIQVQGIYLGEEDAAMPAATFQSTKPPAWAAGRFLIDRVRAGVASFQFGNNMSLQNPGDPNEAEGFGATLATTGGLRGSMDPLDELVATRDVIAAVKAGSEHIVLAQAGSVAGNRIAIVVPKAQYMPPNDRNDQGLRRREIPFVCNGAELGASIVFW